MSGKYGGRQAGMTRLEFDPMTGELVPVTPEVEVSANTRHEYGPWAGFVAPKKTNIGTFASMAAIGGDALTGGASGASGAAPSAASGGTAATSPFNAMASKGLLSTATGGGGGIGGGMGFGKLAALTGLQSGLGILGGLFEPDPEKRAQTGLEYYTGTGEWSDPVATKTRNNKLRTAILRGFADRAQRPVIGRGGERSPIEGLDFGDSDLVAMIDSMFSGGPHGR